ncbi:MAG TPA: TlpA disulfide reductase family protein [Dermatophilaceae bacterium]|nr:TlpA disulfide reductase family protein [Dermatophilaceae bacterium]
MSPVTTVDQPKGLRERVRDSRLGTLLVLAVTAAIVMGGTYLVNGGPEAKAGVSAVNVAPGTGAAPKVGTPAQDFDATTVDGKKVSLSSYKGQAVWLTFGASWCAACQAEAPDIQAAYLKAKSQGAVVLAISISEDSATVLEYATRIGLTYPQVTDPDTRIASAYRVNGIPAHFFIDKSGILRSQKTGGLNPETMDAALREISR